MENTSQNVIQLLILIGGLLGILGTFASIVAMFVSIKNKVEQQSRDVHKLENEIKDVNKQLVEIIRLEGRINTLERGRK